MTDVQIIVELLGKVKDLDYHYAALYKSIRAFARHQKLIVYAGIIAMLIENDRVKSQQNRIKDLEDRLYELEKTEYRNEE